MFMTRIISGSGFMPRTGFVLSPGTFEITQSTPKRFTICVSLCRVPIVDPFVKEGWYSLTTDAEPSLIPSIRNLMLVTLEWETYKEY